MSRTTSVALSTRVRQLTATRAPSRAKARAMPAPSPRLAPVTSAVWPSSSPMARLEAQPLGTRHADEQRAIWLRAQGLPLALAGDWKQGDGSRLDLRPPP